MNRFDTLAKTWDDNPSRIKYSEAISAYIREHINTEQKRTALEVGAGTGTLSIMLEDAFDSIDLLDGAEGMVESISQKLRENGLTHMTAIHDSYQDFHPDKTYNVVYSAMFLHHMIDTDAVLNKLYGLIKGEGKLFLCDLYTEDGRFHPNTAEGVYHHGFDPDLLANKLKESGFTINNIQTVYNFNKHDRLYPMFLIECTKLRP